jgi:hypothetical protein
MGVAEKGSKALRKLKLAAQKRASGLPTGNLINAVVDHVNQFETGIKHTVDGVQDKVKGLQANLLKMYQAQQGTGTGKPRAEQNHGGAGKRERPPDHETGPHPYGT